MSAIGVPSALPRHSPLNFAKNVSALEVAQLIKTMGKQVLDYKFRILTEAPTLPMLHFVLARFDDPALVKTLIDLGADVDECGPVLEGTSLHAYMERFRSTPLNREILELLLQNTGNVNAPNRLLFTPLHLALYNCPGEPDWEIVRLLLEHKAEPDAKTTDGDTPRDLLLLKSDTYPSSDMEAWEEKFLDLVEKYATVPPLEIPLDRIKGDLKIIVKSLTDFSSAIATPQPLPNPLLALNPKIRKLSQENGISILHAHGRILRELEKQLSPYFYQWRRSSYPAFADLFDPETYAYLQVLFKEDERGLKRLNAKKTSN